MVSSIATIYKKLKLDTHENLGWGRIHLPEMELHTTAWWLALDPAAVAGWRRDELDAALVGAGRALQTVASVLLMSDPHDLGMVAQVQSPHAERPVIYLWEAVPGGVGLSPRLFERTDELVGGRPRPGRAAATARSAARPASGRAARAAWTAARWPRACCASCRRGRQPASAEPRRRQPPPESAAA